MAFVKIMIHAVWGTKNREPYLTNDIRTVIIKHIKENAKNKEIFIDTLNGYTEHLHCLLGLNADMSISKTMHLIKGESSFWINKQKITPYTFEWADEYFAVSVSESILDKVRLYIRNQEEHHRKVVFNQEYEEFIRKHHLGSHG
ncbi:MAG: putative transposase [Candidatus Jettenia ecosi]|uniref:Putative transposase n=1 Tax=Candidatus Jettenia ecosi TaxID=2494326 RepID=A0A533QFC1_9BACT|nr:MAG: putative transposase [Candidatus Jettenia ecosi]